jgi:hypothetical protein
METASDDELAWLELELKKRAVDELVSQRPAASDASRKREKPSQRGRTAVSGLQPSARRQYQEMSNAEIMGRRRAKLVATLVKELNVLRPLMEIPEDDYPKLLEQNPNYEVFKICKKMPSAARWVKLLPDRRTVHTIAYELAAAKLAVKSATIATAWKRYKPRKIKPQ